MRVDQTGEAGLLRKIDCACRRALGSGNGRKAFPLNPDENLVAERGRGWIKERASKNVAWMSIVRLKRSAWSCRGAKLNEQDGCDQREPGEHASP